MAKKKQSSVEKLFNQIKHEQEVLSRFYRAVDLITNKGYSINKAAKEAHISKNTIRSMNAERGNYFSPTYHIEGPKKNKPTGNYEINTRRSMHAIVYDQGSNPEIVKVNVDAKYASTLGHYWNQIKNVRENGEKFDTSKLPQSYIFDTNGQAYHLVTNTDDLLLFMQQNEDDFEPDSELMQELYQIEIAA
jgi:hypothetical protein